MKDRIRKTVFILMGGVMAISIVLPLLGPALP